MTKYVMMLSAILIICSLSGCTNSNCGSENAVNVDPSFVAEWETLIWAEPCESFKIVIDEKGLGSYIHDTYDGDEIEEGTAFLQENKLCIGSKELSITSFPATCTDTITKLDPCHGFEYAPKMKLSVNARVYYKDLRSSSF